ncbi:glutamate-1-semialdehyde 2,1-aminomutase [bacterium]|nr:glutamate-1-semialdehyde 2,1-aminomutase [bacterium]
MFEISQKLWKEANSYLIGGVNSPVRAFKAVGGTPVFIDHAEGSMLYDADGNEYLDYVGSWGPMILGHRHPDVISAIQDAIERGTSFGAPTEAEIRLAKLVVEMVPSVERVRMVSSGTEAAMSAIRLARGYTGRDKIVKFEGCYHGHADSLLVKAGSGATTLGIPDSKGVPVSLAQDTITLPFNDPAALKSLFEKDAGEIAAVILEPVVGNMGVVPPENGFLEKLRELTKRFDILLIFDEVMTGFRLSIGGAQKLYGVMPDLTCLGKIIGGGLPVGAVGGKKEIMEYLAPAGPVYQAGTLSGNPVAMAAGAKTLELLQKEGIYERLEAKADKLAKGLYDAAKESHIEIKVQRAGSMFCPFFTSQRVVDYRTAKSSNTEQYARFFWSLLEQGVYVPPSQFEAHFISLAHEDEDIDKTIGAIHKAMSDVKKVKRP